MFLLPGVVLGNQATAGGGHLVVVPTRRRASDPYDFGELPRQANRWKINFDGSYPRITRRVRKAYLDKLSFRGTPCVRLRETPCVCTDLHLQRNGCPRRHN